MSSTQNHNSNASIPANACNSHLHIIDPAYPNDGAAAAQIGTVSMYKEIAERFQIPRAVFVQAKPFALDNSCLVDAIKEFGIANARGVAVVSQKVSDSDLSLLNDAGVRGLRFSVWNASNAVVSFNDCAPLAGRIADMGWHVQLHMSAAQLCENISIIEKLPCPIVIDHMGRLNPSLGTKDPAFRLICKLIDAGNTWVKLSGPYLNTRAGYPWDDAATVAEAFVDFAPERLVWGSDFPHVTEKQKPDESILIDTIDRWLSSDTLKDKVLVQNPSILYGF